MRHQLDSIARAPSLQARLHDDVRDAAPEVEEEAVGREPRDGDHLARQRRHELAVDGARERGVLPQVGHVRADGALVVLLDNAHEDLVRQPGVCPALDGVHERVRRRGREGVCGHGRVLDRVEGGVDAVHCQEEEGPVLRVYGALDGA